jgi:hypothetical protein
VTALVVLVCVHLLMLQNVTSLVLSVYILVLSPLLSTFYAISTRAQAHLYVLNLGALIVLMVNARYTRDVSVAVRALNELDNGITYINAPTIGAEAHLPFGGVKATGNGHREGGWEVYEFYSETKVVYVDYSGSLQRAQIDNY